jgi:hypothetical protein
LGKNAQMAFKCDKTAKLSFGSGNTYVLKTVPIALTDDKEKIMSHYRLITLLMAVLITAKE